MRSTRRSAHPAGPTTRTPSRARSSRTGSALRDRDLADRLRGSPPGHRLQLRVTSTDLPTHLPGRYRFDPEDPTGLAVELNQPATNTVRFGRSVLVLPVLPD